MKRAPSNTSDDEISSGHDDAFLRSIRPANGPAGQKFIGHSIAGPLGPRCQAYSSTKPAQAAMARCWHPSSQVPYSDEPNASVSSERMSARRASSANASSRRPSSTCEALPEFHNASYVTGKNALTCLNPAQPACAVPVNQSSMPSRGLPKRYGFHVALANAPTS